MKNSILFLIVCLILQLSISSSGLTASKKTVAKYKTSLKQAKDGSPKAMFLVARMLERGRGTKKNVKEASKWYQRSASQNYAAANARLGKLYLEGIGVKQNTKKAFSLLNLAAIQGIPTAQFNLAIIYELGVGTNKDFQEAIKWYDFAAKGGYYAAIDKSNNLRKQLGLNARSNTEIAASSPVVTPEPKNKTLQGIGPIDSSEPSEETNTEDEVDTLTDPEPTDRESTTIEDGITDEISIQDEPPIEPETTSDNSTKANSEQQNLQSNVTKTSEIKSTNTPIVVHKLTKQQKIALIKNQNIKRTLQTLLRGRWFDKNRPVHYLPSPKANCGIINDSDIKCTSRELQRHTGKETIYYKTIGKISKLTSKGSFIIQYQNTVIRVKADRIVTQDGVLYQSNIKTGLQKKIHQLKCQYKDIKNLICIKDDVEKHNFKNRIIAE